MNVKKTMIALTLVSSLAIGAGTAFAQDDTVPPTTDLQPGFRGPRGNFPGFGFGEGGPGFGHHGPRGDGFGFRGEMRGRIGGGGGVIEELLEEYTGLEHDAIREAHLSGQTLAELIEANGQSVDDFVAAAVAAASERIDAAVANDRITETVATEMKANLEAQLTERLNNNMPLRQRIIPNAAAEDADA